METYMWFNVNDLIKYDIIELDDLAGYVLPHAGTKFSGQIISHTLRFRPRKMPNNIFLIYLPANTEPDTFWESGPNLFDSLKHDKLVPLYHEFSVPWLSLMHFFGDIPTYAYNMFDEKCDTSRINAETLFVVSADYAHFLPHQTAIELENRAANSIMFASFIEKLKIAIDDERSFHRLYELIPADWMLQHVGRTRSPGTNAVGYMSFLIRQPTQRKPDGFFITAYDTEFVARECLGEWSQAGETELISKVLQLAKTTSRLTGGTRLNVPIIGYTITYLYRSSGRFIRGWHGIRCDAFYLPTVMLEHAYDNGRWLKHDDTEWPKFTEFDPTETLNSLGIKAGTNRRHNLKQCQLYESSVKHVLISQ